MPELLRREQSQGVLRPAGRGVRPRPDRTGGRSLPRGRRRSGGDERNQKRTPKVVARKKAKVKLTLTVKVTPKTGGKANLERINLDTFKWKRVKSFKVAKSGKATVKVPKAGRYRVTLLAGKTLAQSSSAAITFK